MRATVMYSAGDGRIETVPDARLIAPTDAFVLVTRAAICGSALWPYRSMEPSETGRHTGHEFIGVVDAVGADVHTLNVGDLVVAPFVWSGGTCIFCREGLQTSCLHGAGTALTTSMVARVKRCVFRSQTARLSPCRLARIMR